MLIIPPAGDFNPAGGLILFTAQYLWLQVGGYARQKGNLLHRGYGFIEDTILRWNNKMRKVFRWTFNIYYFYKTFGTVFMMRGPRSWSGYLHLPPIIWSCLQSFIIGTRITVVNQTATCDTKAYFFRSSLIALRHNDAKTVLVKKFHEQSDCSF